MLRTAFAAIGLALASVCARGQEREIVPDSQVPDAIYVSGVVYTMDDDRPRAEAIAVKGDRIAAVGSSGDIKAMAGPETLVHDLGGRTVLPGLIDAHGHMAALGMFGLGRLDLSSAKSFDELVTMVASKAKEVPEGEWILGGRWDHESWPAGELPTHEALSRAVPDHPVWLERVDGHAGLANAAAMRLAGVQAGVPSPLGGEVIFDAQGEPTGLLIDNAMRLVERHIEEPAADPAAVLAKAQEICLAVGLTGVHDMGIAPADVEVYLALAADGRLKLRVYGVIAGEHAVGYFDEHGITEGDRLTVRAAKLYADGAMGSRGAWLLEAYADRPTDASGLPYRGLAVMQPEMIFGIAAHALSAGYQVCTHAIGDAANREVLDAYERALRDTPAEDHRFRIEHAQLLHEADIPRFAKLGVIASMQPAHCTSDMRWVEERIGPERAKGAYACRSLLDAGATIAGGSDFPVESPNPFLGLHAAVTRQNAAGEPEGGWRSEQRITREEALRAFTLGAAYAAFEEGVKGSITPGKFADFVVVDRDVMTCEPGEIAGTKVLRTVIGGETVYSAE